MNNNMKILICHDFMKIIELIMKFVFQEIDLLHRNAKEILVRLLPQLINIIFVQHCLRKCSSGQKIFVFISKIILLKDLF